MATRQREPGLDIRPPWSAGTNERRFPATRCASDGNKAITPQSREEAVGFRRASEKEDVLVGLEGPQAHVRARRDVLEF
jgi:hypothetical protein